MAAAPKSGLSGLLGQGSVAQQFLLWGVLQQLAGAILQPVVQQILDETWPRLTSMRLSPAVAADLVLKGWWDEARGEAEAAANGIDAERFKQLVNDTGEPIGLEQLLFAYRRNILEWDKGKGGPPSVMEGIRQSRVRDEWADTIKALRLVPISASDAVAAVVRGQIDHALGEQIAYYNGIDSANFTILINTYGSPPGPAELIELVRRGFIPETGTGPDVLSLQQGIYEGDQKNKWWPAYRELTQYHPPPRTITALERAGSITQAEALKLYTESGLSAHLAAAYSENASGHKLAKTKQLAETTVLGLYRDQRIDHPTAVTFLADLGYSAAESDYVLSWEDVHRELAAVNSAITKIANQFITRKIGTATAHAALDALGLPSAQRDGLLRTWTLERTATVHTLTPAQIAGAVYYELIDYATGVAALEALGYDAVDAALLVDLRLHGLQPGEAPARGTITGQKP